MLEFLTPLGWLVACAAAIPAAAAVLRGRRDDRVRTLLRLPAPGRRARAGGAAAAAVAIGLLAAAAARPAIRTAPTGHVRTDAQIFFVLDTSRSMLAQRQNGEIRFDRAVSAAEYLETALSDFPAGIASLTDRPLPHLFPTADRVVFSAVLHRSIGIERPPPEAGSTLLGRATSFASLGQLATASYFPSRIRHRLVILLTDGESGRFDAGSVATTLADEHVGLLVIRFWNQDERVYSDGKPEAYRPDPQSLPSLRALTDRELGLYAESALPAAERRARRWLADGPTLTAGRPHRIELSSYVALAAAIPLALLLRRRDP